MTVVWRVLMLMGIVGIAACGSMSEHMTRFGDTQRAYERAIRWGDFDTVLSAHRNEKGPLSDSERKRLANIRVTDYKVINTKSENNSKRFIQQVEIRYYNQEYATQKTLPLTVEWEQDEQTKSWAIVSPMPKFR